MARRVFFSFHYEADNWRTSQVRNIGMVEGNRPVTDNKWEQIKRGGSRAIRNWIDGQLDGKTCTIVLIGAQTAGRKWIEYEIQKSWEEGKGVLGIYIHNLLDRYGRKSTKGRNPFADIPIDRYGRRLSRIVKAYDPPRLTSRGVYSYISANIVSWVEEAISIRDNY